MTRSHKSSVDKARYRKAIKEGKCPKCQQPRDEDGALCNACRAMYREVRKAKGDAKLCQRCGPKTPAVAGKVCRRCWFKRIATDNLGATRHSVDEIADQLERLWEWQEGCCALTGEQMVPGPGASLDHVTPRSKGGTDARENLRWVTFEVNRAKSDLSDMLFIDLCRKVWRHWEY